jgi:hypothetical protein
VIADLQSMQAVNAFLADVASDFQRIDWRPWMSGSMRDMERAHAAMLAEQRDPSDAPWAPLAPSTIAKKKSDIILIDKGELQKNLTDPNRGIREMTQEGDTIEMIFGPDFTDVPYSKFLLQGTTRMPRRDHVGLPINWFDHMTGTACDHALAELKQ